jgi:hypothetical protein
LNDFLKTKNVFFFLDTRNLRNFVQEIDRTGQNFDAAGGGDGVGVAAQQLPQLEPFDASSAADKGTGL